MAKVRRKPQLAPLVVGIHDPGMSPMLRTGLGGLAASLRAIARSRGEKRWPVEVTLGGASFEVQRQRVVIDWHDSDPAKALEELFRHSFLVDRDGIMSCAAWYDGRHVPSLAVRARLQSALKGTFLHHGKFTEIRGSPIQRTDEIDDVRVTVEYQPYASFKHQRAHLDVAKAVRSGSVSLASWVYPGAVQRHVAYADTKCEYTAGQALAGCFAIAGSVSLNASRGGGGILVMLVPDDLIQFAKSRPTVTPMSVTDAVIAGVGDAVLLVESLLRARAAEERPGVAKAMSVLMRATPWETHRKLRVAVIEGNVSADVLDTYETAARELKAKVRTRADDDEEQDDAGGFFVTTSALRAFIADNLAVGRRWFEGFSTARTPEKNARFIHTYRESDNLGALFMEERPGLIKMTEDHLEDAEKSLVRSIHLALRQRFGAIADESGSNEWTMKNRWKGERDRLRLAFAGSKTQEQVRAALADLWSRAGPNRELQENWEQVVVLLRAGRWQLARDLALVALASYRGRGAEINDTNVNGGAE